MAMLNRSARLAATLQIAYYAVTGAWPLLAYRTFEVVTGPKREPWLVKTVGLLTLAIAASMAQSVRRGDARGTANLGFLAAIAFAATDLWYGLVRRRLGLPYLMDAALQLAIVGAWWRHSRNPVEWRSSEQGRRQGPLPRSR